MKNWGKMMLNPYYNGFMSRVISLDEEELALVVEECARVLKGGGLAIVPTDTVYGMASRVDNPEAVGKIFELKGRNAEKALVVMVSSREEAARLVAPHQRESVLGLGSLWPGPLTLVAKAGDLDWGRNVAPLSETLGIRVPASPFMLRLMDLTGPLAVTSANPSGGGAPSSLREVEHGLMDSVDIAVDGGRCGSGKPSTVAEISGDRVKILRRGEIGGRDLRIALRGGTGRRMRTKGAMKPRRRG